MSKLKYGIPAVGFAVLMPTTSDANSVVETCLPYDTEHVCECAMRALMMDLGTRDFAAYAVVAKHAMEHQAAGLSLVDAWAQATETHSVAFGLTTNEATQQVNGFGEDHRSAIKKCK